MLCRMYTGGLMGCCNAVQGDHHPSLLERERYCINAGTGCPILAAYEARGQLSEGDYLQVWSEPPIPAELAYLAPSGCHV